MKNKFLFHSLLLLAFLITGPAVSFAADGVIQVESQNSFQVTRQKLLDALKAKGMTVFAVVDHAQGARSVGLDLRPTTVVIFGNPKVGTRLMQCAQSAGIDLPMKALIMEDEKGDVCVAYNDPVWLAARHGASDCKVVPKISKALAHFAAAATSR